MPRNRGIDPTEFNNEDDEIVDVRYINLLAQASQLSLDSDVAESLEEVIDTLYAMGYSPEYVDEILRTRELSEGSWN